MRWFHCPDFCVVTFFSTIWYELQVGVWPITDHPVEAKIWLLGSSGGIKRVLAEANLGKEVTVSLFTFEFEPFLSNYTFELFVIRNKQ